MRYWREVCAWGLETDTYWPKKEYKLTPTARRLLIDVAADKANDGRYKVPDKRPTRNAPELEWPWESDGVFWGTVETFARKINDPSDEWRSTRRATKLLDELGIVRKDKVDWLPKGILAYTILPPRHVLQQRYLEHYRWRVFKAWGEDFEMKLIREMAQATAQGITYRQWVLEEEGDDVENLFPRVDAATILFEQRDLRFVPDPELEAWRAVNAEQMQQQRLEWARKRKLAQETAAKAKSAKPVSELDALVAEIRAQQEGPQAA